MTSPHSAEHEYTEVPPTRTVSSNDSFLAGQIDFPFSIGAPNVCDLSKSYFRFELELLGEAGVAPTIKDQVAFADNVVDSMITNTYFRMGGQDASSISSQQPQSSMVKNRLSRTQPYLASVSKDTCLDEADFSMRVIKTANDAKAETGIADHNETYRGVLTNADWTTATLTVSGEGERNRAELGYDAATNSFEVKAAAIEITQTGGANLPTGLWAAGDEFLVLSGATSGASYVVIAVTVDTAAATTLTIAGGVAQAIGTGYFARSRTGFVNASVNVFAATDVGNTLFVDGVPATIITYQSPTQVTTSYTSAIRPASTNWYMTRRNLTRSSTGRNRVYVNWQPPIGVFSIENGHQFAAGDYRINLVGNQNFLKTAVETNRLGAVSPANYTINVKGLIFYLHTSKATVDDGESIIHMTELNTQPKAWASSLQFSVPSSTYALTVFLQDARVGSDPLYKITQATAPAREDLQMTTLQVSYANTTKTTVPYNSRYELLGGSLTNTLQQRYLDSLTEAGVDVGFLGAETFDQWLKRGALYHFSFDRDMDNRSTEVQIRSTIPTPPVAGTVNMFVTAHYRKTVSYTTQKGLITSVSILEI